MKTAVTGSNGFVGSELVRRGCIPIRANVLDTDELVFECRKINPDIVIHCASMTNVDECEKDTQSAFDVNVNGTMNVINVFHKSFIVYLSTDHVFNGKHRLWLPNENTKPDPINVYGLTKYAGEVMMHSCIQPYMIVRSSKLFNLSTLKRDILDLKCGVKKEYTGLIHRNFTHLSHFVDMLFTAINTQNNKRIVHLATPLSRSYYTFWNMVADKFEIDKSLISERRFGLPDVSPRPFKGGLDTKMIPLKYSVSDGIDLAYEEYILDVRGTE
jgi:dTDP-4-dehydrorhamnose reductase